MTNDTQELLSKMLTANLQTLNVLKEVQESVENQQTLTVEDLDSAFERNLTTVLNKLTTVEELVKTVDGKMTNIQTDTSRVTDSITTIEENVKVLSTGLTTLIDMNEQIDVENVLKTYDSEKLQAMVNALVTTQDNVKKLVLIMQAINNEMTHVKTELSELNESYVDTNSRMKTIEMKETIEEFKPQSIDDTIKELSKYT